MGKERKINRKIFFYLTDKCSQQKRFCWHWRKGRGGKEKRRSEGKRMERKQKERDKDWEQKGRGRWIEGILIDREKESS